VKLSELQTQCLHERLQWKARIPIIGGSGLAMKNATLNKRSYTKFMMGHAQGIHLATISIFAAKEFP
jgi:hypothetical protein